MSNLFTMLPFAVENSSLPVIPASDRARLFGNENDAYEHWIFDKGNATDLTGEVNGRVLTPQTTTPTYASGYLSLPSTKGLALLSDFAEVAGQEDTVCVVFRHAVSSGVIVPFGSIGETAEGTGGAPFVSGAGQNLFVTQRPVISSSPSGLTVADGVWYFLAVSRKLTTSGYVRTLLGGSALYEITGNYSTYAPAPSPRKVAIGSAYLTTQVGVTLDFAEALIYNRGLTSNELSGLYSRAKARMLNRGISVV